MMKNSSQQIFNAKSIGSVALEALSKDQDALVFGKTSKGVYIKTASRWLVFLSFDHFRGPLTITFREANPVFQNASPGKSIKVISQRLAFRHPDTLITLQDSEVWQPQPARTPPGNDAERHARLVWFTQEALLVKKEVGLSYLLGSVLGLPLERGANQEEGRIDWPGIQGLQKHLRNGEVDPAARLLANLLGCGPGLTPSGDDFCTGFLLTLNRWQNSGWTAADLGDLNGRVVGAAYAKTTTLSANLIECATFGLSNERLINALDWLVTGAARESEVVLPLLDWGHSSGVDALTGMAVALMTFM